ncbi:MAG: hypothetical protein WCJ37_20135, partial [Syntrophus sp. (in: bacteria)]
VIIVSPPNSFLVFIISEIWANTDAEIPISNIHNIEISFFILRESPPPFLSQSKFYYFTIYRFLYALFEEIQYKNAKRNVEYLSKSLDA